ncbi:CaiB/BaiF CoA transferase family protein [Cupriavidus basilensis]|uniref:CaiB/BaiF CoA transferase family protein n=1 Tax=Cupriavidus basilensis TaxID=68895 RepID=UPI0023E81EF5|nr:CoA transferase [Cupriavidus basilensis]MDF3881841.1 CoA transferase [Cupriavidus basilensis]
MTSFDRADALPASTQPLHGIVVLDFSHVIAGPFATYYLAALGARVIKVENPHRGDSLRNKPTSFASLNHGKEIVQLDLATDEGKARAWELFAEADVMVDNMRPGVLEKFGFGESQVRARKPELIFCAISGYGRQSEWASRPAYDHVIQAVSGMSLLTGAQGDGPIKVGFPVVDSVTGILSALALIAAIRRRDLTGLGESIDVSMLGAALQLMYPMTVDVMSTGKTPNRVGNVGYSGSPGAETFVCRDGLLAVGANTPQQMLRMAEILNIRHQVEPLLAGQSRGFVGSSHAEELRALLHEAVGKHSAKELETSLNDADVPSACVRDLGECVQDAVKFNLVEQWVLPETDAVKVPGLGFRTAALFGGNPIPY